MENAVRVNDAVLRHPLHAAGDQRGLRLLEGFSPDTVVAQHALAADDVVGSDLGEQVRAVLVLDLQQTREFLPHPLVDGGNTSRSVPPVLDVHGVLPALNAQPVLPEPHPLTVMGQVLHQPLHGIGHVIVVTVGGQHPGRAALEDREGFHLVHDGRNDLVGTGTGADDGNTLARNIDVVVPFR